MKLEEHLWHKLEKHLWHKMGYFPSKEGEEFPNVSQLLDPKGGEEFSNVSEVLELGNLFAAFSPMRTPNPITSMDQNTS